jgi:DNA-binding protein H-NS
MSTLAELQRQKVELEKQIETAKKSERAEALKTVKKLCKEFGFTAGMLRGSLIEKRKGK